MPEVADTCECHRKPGVVGGFDHFVVTNRSARLNDGCGARFRHGKQPVSERKERVGRSGRTFG